MKVAILFYKALLRICTHMSRIGRLTSAPKENIISYMKRDSRLSSVLHALLHMAEQEEPMTSDALARCLGTNPVVVRRTMRGWPGSNCTARWSGPMQARDRKSL